MKTFGANPHSEHVCLDHFLVAAIGHLLSLPRRDSRHFEHLLKLRVGFAFDIEIWPTR